MSASEQPCLNRTVAVKLTRSEFMDSYKVRELHTEARIYAHVLDFDHRPRRVWRCTQTATATTRLARSACERAPGRGARARRQCARAVDVSRYPRRRHGTCRSVAHRYDVAHALGHG